jgi:hypothetical protein
MTKPPLPLPVEVSVWNTQRVLRFSHSAELAQWADTELLFWNSVQVPQANHTYVRNWSNQVGAWRELISNLGKIDDADTDERAHKLAMLGINAFLARLRDGTVLTADSHGFEQIASLAKTDPDAAALANAALRSDARSVLSDNSVTPYTLARLSIFLPYGSQEADEPIHRRQLAELKSNYEFDLSELRKRFDEHDAHVTEWSDEKPKRSEQWDGELSKVRSEWAGMRAVYDETLALKAPATYWSNRASSSAKAAAVWGLSFVVGIAGIMCLFVVMGIPHLLTAAADKDASPILSIAPIVIPAFAAIWVLRIIGRLLSESVQLMRDAREREMMCMTFLALMKSDVRERSLISDEDRLLMLHSLFRPSAVTAADDSPPAHWFDLLASKIGKNAK